MVECTMDAKSVRVSSELRAWLAHLQDQAGDSRTALRRSHDRALYPALLASIVPCQRLARAPMREPLSCRAWGVLEPIRRTIAGRRKRGVNFRRHDSYLGEGRGESGHPD